MFSMASLGCAVMRKCLSNYCLYIFLQQGGKKEKTLCSQVLNLESVNEKYIGGKEKRMRKRERKKERKQQKKVYKNKTDLVLPAC